MENIWKLVLRSGESTPAYHLDLPVQRVNEITKGEEELITPVCLMY